MRDYFDWFLVAVSDYQNKLKCGDTDFTKFETYLHENPEYDPLFLEIKDWEERFFLQPYFEEGRPVWLFETPSEMSHYQSVYYLPVSAHLQIQDEGM